MAVTNFSTLRVEVSAVDGGDICSLNLAINLHVGQMSVSTIVHQITQECPIRPANWLDVRLDFVDGVQYPGQEIELKRAIHHAILLDSTEADSV